MSQQSTAPNSAEDPLDFAIELIVVPGLKSILFELRKAVSAEVSPGDAREALVGTVTVLHRRCLEWRDILPRIPGLAQMLVKFSEWIKIQAQRIDTSRNDGSLLSGYFSFESMTSQLADSVDQGRIDRGVAPTRFEFINEIMARGNIDSYLEIGCCGDSCFSRINCRQKVGVDPEQGGTLRMTSDAFFEVNVQVFDLIFIDGLHESRQVDRDIVNALRWTSPQGIIVMHDCDPKFEVRTLVPRVSEVWNGDVWKSFVKVRSRPDLDCATGLFDHGTAVIVKRPSTGPMAAVSENELNWDNLQRCREEWLRPTAFDVLLDWIEGPQRL